MQQLSDLIERIVVTSSLGALRMLLKEACFTFGYEKFAYTVRFPSGSIQGAPQHLVSCHDLSHGKILQEREASYLSINNWADELLKIYKDNGYLNLDPGLKHSWHTPTPLHYDETWIQQQMNCAPQEAAVKLGIFLSWFSYDFLDGFSVGIQGPRGEAATLSFSTDQLRNISPVSVRLATVLAQGILPYVHHRAMEFTQWPDFFQKTFHLTPREMESLRWASEGKTAWEIGEILNISERTAIAHLSNACAKLGANNRIQAVARAIAYKII